MRGGWGRRPREIVGAKEEGERPGSSRSQPIGLDREAWVAEAPESTGVESPRGEGGWVRREGGTVILPRCTCSWKGEGQNFRLFI